MHVPGHVTSRLALGLRVEQQCADPPLREDPCRELTALLDSPWDELKRKTARPYSASAQLGLSCTTLSYAFLALSSWPSRKQHAARPSRTSAGQPGCIRTASWYLQTEHTC